MGNDLHSLRADFPQWRFGTVWRTAATGPDCRSLWATRNGVQITAHTEDALRAQLESVEREEGWQRGQP